MNQRPYAGLSFTNNSKDARIQKAQTTPRELWDPETSSLSPSFMPQSTRLWSRVLEEVKWEVQVIHSRENLGYETFLFITQLQSLVNNFLGAMARKFIDSV